MPTTSFGAIAPYIADGARFAASGSRAGARSGRTAIVVAVRGMEAGARVQGDGGPIVPLHLQVGALSGRRARVPAERSEQGAADASASVRRQREHREDAEPGPVDHAERRAGGLPGELGQRERGTGTDPQQELAVDLRHLSKPALPDGDFSPGLDRKSVV